MMNKNRNHLNSVIVPAVANPMFAPPVILLLGDGQTLVGGVSDPEGVIDHFHVTASLMSLDGPWTGPIDAPSDFMGNFSVNIESITDPGQGYYFRVVGISATGQQVTAIGTSQLFATL